MHCNGMSDYRHNYPDPWHRFPWLQDRDVTCAWSSNCCTAIWHTHPALCQRHFISSSSYKAANENTECPHWRPTVVIYCIVTSTHTGPQSSSHSHTTFDYYAIIRQDIRAPWLRPRWEGCLLVHDNPPCLVARRCRGFVHPCDVMLCVLGRLQGMWVTFT